MITQKLEKEIKSALKKLSINVENISFEHPADLSHGDYSTNVCMVLAKRDKKNPIEIAKALVAELSKKKIKEVEKVEVAGPGFVNFSLSKEFFVKSVGEILKQKDKFGSNKIGKGKKVVVEYSSPNIAKPFSIGHLRSTIIGDAIANTLAFSGFKVIRDNHLGDWGTQFGKMIVAIRKWGDEEKIEHSESPVKELVNLYVKFHEEAEKNKELEEQARECFAKLERGEPEAVRIWQKCVKWSLVDFNKIYRRLGINFDTAFGESFFMHDMAKTVEIIKKAGIGKESEGAFLIFFPEDKLPPLMLIKSDGATIYAVRDLAADLYRRKTYGKNVVILNEVGLEQSLYFKQLFEAEKMLGWFKEGQRVHIGHGLYSFNGEKMSTRKGNTIWLDDVLNEVIEKAGEINKETAEIVGIGALKFNDLKREPINDVSFDLQNILDLKGDSGPYLQYTHARACSILQKGKDLKIKESLKTPNPLKIQSELERLIYRFPEVVERSAAKYSPNYIAQYLIDLAGSFNNFYAQNKIVDKENVNAGYFLSITKATTIVIKNGLKLLGIVAPEKM